MIIWRHSVLICFIIIWSFVGLARCYWPRVFSRKKNVGFGLEYPRLGLHLGHFKKSWSRVKILHLLFHFESSHFWTDCNTNKSCKIYLFQCQLLRHFDNVLQIREEICYYFLQHNLMNRNTENCGWSSAFKVVRIDICNEPKSIGHDLNISSLDLVPGLQY